MRLSVLPAASALVLALAAPAAVADDLIDVTTSTFFPVVQAGGFGEVTCAVANNTPGPLRVHIHGTLRYQGLGRERVLGPSIIEIPEGITLEIAPLFFVPEDAEPGPAAFTCDAHVAGPVEGGKKGDPRPATHASSTSQFLVE